MILFLGERGLTLRGKNETITCVHHGNFWQDAMAFQLCTLSDTEIQAGRASHLSPTICNEFIDIIEDLMLKKIIGVTKESKYYGIIVDSTPDLSHVDQLTFILRCVDPVDLEPVEWFLQFIQICSPQGKSLPEVILDFVYPIML